MLILHACVCSCINGLVMEKYHRSSVRDYMPATIYACARDFTVEQPEALELCKHFDLIQHKAPVPTEIELAPVLRQIGKFKAPDELNCGSCGYNSCREKAGAIFQGKAENSICLPFLKDRAESFPDTIVNTLPAV